MKQKKVHVKHVPSTCVFLLYPLEYSLMNDEQDSRECLRGS